MQSHDSGSASTSTKPGNCWVTQRTHHDRHYWPQHLRERTPHAGEQPRALTTCHSNCSPRRSHAGQRQWCGVQVMESPNHKKKRPVWTQHLIPERPRRSITASTHPPHTTSIAVCTMQGVGDSHRWDPAVAGLCEPAGRCSGNRGGANNMQHPTTHTRTQHPQHPTLRTTVTTAPYSSGIKMTR